MPAGCLYRRPAAAPAARDTVPLESGVSQAQYTSFVPSSLVARLVAGEPPLALRGVAFLVDISGFTRLSEALIRAGPAGVEQVTQILNTAFGAWIDLIAEFGGETIKFAGDAIVALWIVPADPAAVRPELATAALRAVACALRLRDGVDDIPGVNPGTLRVKISLGAGELTVTSVAIGQARRDLLLVGPALREAVDGQAVAGPGEVILGPALRPLLPRDVLADPLPSQHARVRSLYPRSLHARAPAAPPLDSALLRPFVPASVQTRVDAGQGAWLGELRRATVLFTHLVDTGKPTSLPEIADVLAGLADVVERFGGGVNKVSIDDKGVSALSAFGLPPASHPDDPARALQALLALRDEHDLGDLRVGVTTGRVFCGVIGSAIRREYTLIGDVVNFAARLMQTSTGGVVCDRVTAEAAAEAVECLSLGTREVRGRREPVALFTPSARKQARSRTTLERTSKIFGHQPARERLGARVEALRLGRGGVVFLDGDAGLGKSRLARYAADLAQESGIRVFHGGADAREPAAAYHAFRDVFVDLLGLGGGADIGEQRRRVRLALDEPRLLDLAPLLSDVIPIGLPDNDLTRQFEPPVRADNTQHLLLDLVDRRLRGAPALLVIEDAHWFDSASWKLARAFASAGAALLLLLTARPLIERPSELQDMLQADNAEQLHLDGLSEEDAARLLADRVGLAEVPPPLARRLREWSQGNPLFVEQIGLALYEAGLIRRERDRTVFAATPAELNAFRLPSSIEALITSRIDRLTPAQQLTLKVASVVGRTFTMDVLTDIYPIVDEREQLGRVVESLVALKLLAVETAEPRVYGFVHALAQRATYDLMLFEQRRQLHAAVASWLEARGYGELAPWLPILAHHFSRAGAPGEAAKYLERAGALALAGSANREAIELYTSALALADQIDPRPAPERRARWHRAIGDAHLKLAEHDETRRHYAAALQLLGYRPLTGAAAHVVSLMVQLVRQVWYRVAPQRLVRRAGAAAEAALHAAHMYQSLAEIAFFQQDTLRLMHSTFANLNYAERSGADDERAHAYATIAIVAGLFGLHGLAGVYSRWSHAAAERDGGLATIAYARLLQGVYHSTVPHRELAQRGYDEAIAGFERLGDRPRLETAAMADAFYHFALGDLDGVVRRCDPLTATVATSSAKIRAWVHAARVLLAALRDVPAEPDLVALAAVMDEPLDLGDALLVEGTLALGHLRRDDRAAATAWAEKAAARMAGQPPTTMYTSFGVHAALEVMLALDLPALRRRAGRAALLLRILALQNPIVRPRALLARGQLAAARGRIGRAARLLRRCIDMSEKTCNRLLGGLARLELARTLGSGDPARAALWSAACASLGELGVVEPLARLAPALPPGVNTRQA